MLPADGPPYQQNHGLSDEYSTNLQRRGVAFSVSITLRTLNSIIRSAPGKRCARSLSQMISAVPDNCRVPPCSKSRKRSPQLGFSRILPSVLNIPLRL